MHSINCDDGTTFSFAPRKKKMTEEEKLARCRERNKIHARNTRERKKEQNEQLEMKIAQLSAATMRLRQDAEQGKVASILAAMGSIPDFQVPVESSSIQFKEEKASEVGHTSSSSSSTEGFADFSVMHRRDFSSKDPDDIERIRRERNRIHAQKTRMRKKRVFAEMQQAVESLQNEIYSLNTLVQAPLKLAATEPHASIIANSGFFSNTSTVPSTNMDSDFIMSAKGTEYTSISPLGARFPNQSNLSQYLGPMSSSSGVYVPSSMTAFTPPPTTTTTTTTTTTFLFEGTNVNNCEPI